MELGISSDRGGLVGFGLLEPPPPPGWFGLPPARRVVAVRAPPGAAPAPPPPPAAAASAPGTVVVTASGSMVVVDLSVVVGRGRVVVVRGATWVATSNLGDDSPRATSSTRAVRATAASPYSAALYRYPFGMFDQRARSRPQRPGALP